VPNDPFKHWSDYVGLEIAEVLHQVVLTATKWAILASTFLSISVDEVTTIDN
jgi:hypothetical protein